MSSRSWCEPDGFVHFIHLTLVICIFLAQHSNSKMADDVVQTNSGRIRGQVFDDEYLGFLGVPYAAPPIGNRRFHVIFFSMSPAMQNIYVPESADPWDTILDTTEHPPRCMQMNERSDIFGTPKAGTSEDCLYLNVFTAKGWINMRASKAVMVYIHGGSFGMGSAWDSRDQGIVRNLVSKDVIVVVIQYRLGIFGFFTTNDPVASGNWGIWDQLAALKWIQGNIEAFGGDPTRVTIFGESAGSISVSILTYIPLAQELFHQAIEQSGSVYLGPRSPSNWTLQVNAIADSVDCLKGGDVEEEKRTARSEGNKAILQTSALVNCLREIPADKLVQAHRQLFEPSYGATDKSLFGHRWIPTIDGYLIPDTPKQLAMAMVPKPTLIGSNDLEMAYFHAPPKQMVLNNQFGIFVLRQPLDTVEHTFFDRVVAGELLRGGFENINELTTAVKMFYLGSDQTAWNQNKTLIIESFIKMQGDLWFNMPLVTELLDKLKLGTPMWVYSFDYWSESMLYEDYPYKGALHATELMYLFDIDLEVFKFERSEKDKAISQFTSKIWTDFAKNGDPTSEDLTNKFLIGGHEGRPDWKPVESMNNSPTLHIAEESYVWPSFRHAAYQFWNHQLREIDQHLKTDIPPSSDQREEL